MTLKFSADFTISSKICEQAASCLIEFVEGSSSKQMASSSSSRIWNYDVFISFRGEDTRKTFVSHLHKALVTRGISTFKDNRNLEMGECMSIELCRAIQTSKFAVVVISENYATSGWCLDELQLIVELAHKKEIEVIPIFFGVNPSDVRHHLGNFALTKYQGPEMAEKVLRWREALTDIANRKGKDSKQCEDEATMTEEIVQRISSRLLAMLPIDLGDVVGMDAHMEGLMPLLDMDSKNDEVRMIGIWGMGGIGKTSIAKYLYEKVKHQFSPHYCFIQNVRKTSTKRGLLYLQERLLSNILGTVNDWSVDQGTQYIKSRLQCLKVFVVLDDVGDVKQLESLAGKPNWFGPGSRIIITTRDKSLLNSYGVEVVYNVKCLDNDDALQLFQHIAFEGGGGHPPSHVYEDLSTRISRLAQGLPLAIEAFGLYLRGKSLVEWQDALKSCEGAPYENIMSILRTSYNGLDELGKTTFLHVACLFNGEPIWRVMNLLDRGEVGIKVLVEKSLIDIANGCIAMHAFVEQTGRKIVRQESGNKPAEQRILWHHKDIYPVLHDKSGTTKTEGVAVDLCAMPNNFHIEWNDFRPMHNLTFLNLYNHNKRSKFKIQRDAKNLMSPRELRLLHWDGYPYTTLPSSIHVDRLVELNLCNSKLITLWRGTPRLLHLRRLDVSGSKNLRELPDHIGDADCLEELLLEGCSSLKQIPWSISWLSNLKKLDLSNFDGHKFLRIIIEELKIYSFLHIHLVFWGPFEFRTTYEALAYLSIEGFLEINFQHLRGYAEHLFFNSEQQIPQGRTILEGTTSLYPYGFKSLHITRSKCSQNGVPFECCSFSGFPWLTELNLINLNIKKIPYDIYNMHVLEKLDLSGNDFRSLPTSMIQLLKLKDVTLSNCRRLEALPELYQVERLTLSDCTNLRALVSIPRAEQDPRRYSLLELWLDNCNNVESLSDQLRQFINLRYLDISRHDFEIAPTSIKGLTSLVTLCLNYCKKLKSLTELPMSVQCLYAHGCKSLVTSSIPMEHSLDHLDLSYCFHQKQDFTQITRFPGGRRDGEVPICDCFQNTKMLNTSIQIKKSSISTLFKRLKPW